MDLGSRNGHLESAVVEYRGFQAYKVRQRMEGSHIDRYIGQLRETKCQLNEYNDVVMWVEESQEPRKMEFHKVLS
jgi:hypothetical protein